MKKVITGLDPKGKSIFTQVVSPDVTVGMPMVDWTEIWCVNPDDQIPVDQSEEKSRDRYSETHQVFPEQHQALFRVLDMKPGDWVPTEGEAVSLAQALPGLMDHVETEDPGMHTTDSIDFGIIMSGKIVLELDDGAQEELTAGDVFVQNGTRHAWRVTEHCRMAVVLVGVERKG